MKVLDYPLNDEYVRPRHHKLPFNQLSPPILFHHIRREDDIRVYLDLVLNDLATIINNIVYLLQFLLDLLQLVVHCSLKYIDKARLAPQSQMVNQDAILFLLFAILNLMKRFVDLILHKLAEGSASRVTGPCGTEGVLDRLEFRIDIAKKQIADFFHENLDLVLVFIG